VVSRGVNALRSADRAIVLVTHYQRLLDYITPDAVHVMAGGRIVKSGGRELAKELEQTGYAWVGEKPPLGLSPAQPRGQPGARP
jgi:Fe-S cluster assembly ATP-binding protein